MPRPTGVNNPFFIFLSSHHEPFPRLHVPHPRLKDGKIVIVRALESIPSSGISGGTSETTMRDVMIGRDGRQSIASVGDMRGRIRHLEERTETAQEHARANRLLNFAR